MNLKDAVNYEYSEQDMIKPLKNITLSEADSTETFNFKPFEYERGTVTKTAKGIINTIRDMQDIPEQVKIFGKRISFGFGGYFGDTEEETERKKLNLVTAERNLNEAQAERYKYTSPKETESLSYGIGGGIVNYGTMLVPAGLVGGGLKAAGAGAKAISTGAEIAGLGTMSVMELAGQVQDKTPKKDGEIDIEAMTPEWARKATGGTIAYTGLSALTEKYVGFGKQKKMWSKPIKWGGNITSKALTTIRTAGTNALSEGATEGIQDLEATGIGLIDGTLTMDKLPARLQQAWKSAIIGGIIGGGVGTAAAMKSARNVKKQLRDMVSPVVGEQDAQTVAEAIYDAGTDNMTKAMSIELELSSELKNKHGKVWNSMLTAVTKEMEGKPRFEGWSEDQKAHYANTVAKHFADQTLAEANFRGTTLDAVLSASDITWDNGIRLARHINLFDALKNPEMIPAQTKLKRESLLAFLKRQGGLQDYGGELKSRDAQKLYPGIVNKNGMNFDDAALMAWENGYFPSKTERPDINEFLEAVDEGLRGNHRYNTEEERNFSDAIEDLREELDRLGIDYENMTAAEIEKAVDEIPEMKSLEREAAFYEQYEPEVGLSEDEAERLAMETEGKQYPVIKDKDLPEYYQIADENAKLDAENPVYEGETIKINGKDKTVYNSNGERIAKSKEALQNFYKWFGDSKVVDEQGRPLVVYHGTSANFDTFDNTKSQRTVSSYNTIASAYYFTSNNANAQTYGSVVYPVYLNIKKPLIIDYKGKYFHDIVDFDNKTFGKKGYYAKDDIDSLNELVAYAKEKGYNGLIAENIKDSANEKQLRGSLNKDEKKLLNDLKKKNYEELYSEYNKIYPSDESADTFYARMGKRNGKNYILLSIVDYKFNARTETNVLANDYIAFEPNQIKSTQNRGTYITSDNIYYQTGNKVYSVFNLKVGDSLKAYGKVEEINNEKRQIKIGGEWYSMFMIDREAQMGGLTLGEKENIDIDIDEDNEVKKVSENREEIEKQKQKNTEYNNTAKEYFGTTDNLNVAGYILTDGELLDLSGRKFGGDSTTRSIDHREVSDAFDDVSMEDFINSGNIRYMPESGNILMSDVPTTNQYKAIKNILLKHNGNIRIELMNDANNWGSDKDFSREYPAGTTIATIKRDINAFYKGEGVRNITEYLQKNKVAQGSTKVTPDEYIIKLLEGADESTLAHEFAHYWLTEMWNYTRTGRASENYMNRWNIIADYLKIKPEQTRLTNIQQENFASSYEAYLTRGELPTLRIASVFDDYDKWLQQVYNDYNKINYHIQRGKKVYSHSVRLTDAAIKFFQSMTTGTLEAPALAPKNTGVAIPEKTEEVIKPTNEVVETPATYDTTRVINITEGEKGVSKVFQREAMKHADRIVDELGVSYNKINLEEQAVKASEWVQNNLEEARKVVNGAPAPDGIIDTAIFIAYENEMLRIGNNAEYQRALKIHSQVQTQRGQAIAAERITTDDVYNPAYWWKKLQKSQETNVARKLFKGDTDALNQVVETETKNLMKQIAGKPRDEQVEALSNLAKKLQKDYNLDTLYQMPDEVNELTVREFIKDTLGVNPDVMTGNEVINKAEQLQKLWDNTKDSSGNPSVEAMRAKRELNDLIQAQNPSSTLAIWTSIFGRGVMLASVKSPMLNIISNIEAGLTEGITRRIMYKTTEKAVDANVKKEFSNYAWEVYKASGDIVSTMNDYDDDMRVIGEQILHSQGQGAFRAASRKVEEISFKYLMGAPDAVAKTLAFNDTADLLATKIAKEEGAKDISARATEIYKDAILIKPETEVGQKVREQAQAQAHYTTFTNDSWAARFGLSARNWLNMVGRNKVRLGDLTMKFVKTPANVQMMGLEYGFGSLYTLYNIQEVIKNPQSEVSQHAIRAAVRNGLGIALAALLYSMLDPEDYFSEFDTLNPKEKDRMRALGALPNSIKIGNRWVSLDYFGQIAIPLVGMLEARRNDGIRSYIQSGLTQAAKIPGIKETKQLIDTMSEYARYDLKPEKIVQMMAGTVLDQARAMTIPAIVNDVAKMTDDYERDTMGGVFDKVIASIPGLRQTLPERYGVQGVVETEPALSTLLFGSRVKTAQEDRLVREINKLSTKDEQPSISDVTKYGDLRLLSAEKKVKVRKEFYKLYNSESKKLISTREYQKKAPEEQKKALNKVRSRVVKSLKEKYSNNIKREKRRQ